MYYLSKLSLLDVSTHVLEAIVLAFEVFRRLKKEWKKLEG